MSKVWWCENQGQLFYLIFFFSFNFCVIRLCREFFDCMVMFVIQVNIIVIFINLEWLDQYGICYRVVCNYKVFYCVFLVYKYYIKIY